MPCPNNGRLKDSELAPIRPYGRLAKSAAYAWEAPHGPADNGLEPTGPELSTYRDLAGQYKTWATSQAGGPLAAFPGTSEHGCGKCIDLKRRWMRQWIDEHGARFGWRKVEAFSEWWHVNFVGGVSFPPPFKPLSLGSRGRRVKRYTRRLAYIHQPHGHAYLKRWYWRYKQPVRAAVINFQRDHDLVDDGVLGEGTAAAITAVFRRQWENRND